ncbi:glycosyltransferase family protein [Ohtaekwangia sp.]|uniref:glycosyltransferase family protein n=1 Tax=Ohtaekwangia sp. TaxID=2066019 RepID=UPI002F958E61
MKILFAIQGTGNGHLARAEDIVPILQEYGDLDLFVSGAQADIKLPYAVKYKSKGLSFYFGKSGGIDFLRTFKHNSSKEVYKEIKKFPVEKYDLVINDFEPITAWACRKREIPCVGLSHQSALLSSKVPTPKKIDPVGEWVLHNYAPVDKYVSFHFEQYDKNIYTPVIRRAVRESKAVEKDHYTVYLPSYDDKKLVPLLAKIPQIKWHVFSKHAKKPYHIGKLSVYPVNKDEFAESMTSAKGVLCGAGFETPAEALYLGKKLLVVPMKSQLEQHYNAASLKQLGVPVLKKMRKKNLEKIIEWLETDKRVSVQYENITAEAVSRAVKLGRQ